MKKLFSVLLALVLVASFCVTAFAAGETGSITINGVSESGTYEIYRMLDLESYDVEADAYSYKANDAWKTFFQSDEAKVYIATDKDGYVTWIAAEDDDTKANFAKLALAYAKDNGIAPTKSSKNEGEFVVTGNSGKFSDLELGYYLVDSTMGALCGLTTTNPDASVNAKNGTPTVDKQIVEDSTSQWGDSNTADIGQIVEFRVTVSVHAGAENYVLHDLMSEGLTFQGIKKVEHVVPGTGTTVVDPSLYVLKDKCGEPGEDVPEEEKSRYGKECDDTKCTFEVHFDKDFCLGLENNDKLIVYYDAMLNREANINGEGNDNTAWLTFGEEGESNEDKTTTYTYGIDIIKTDSANKLIDGAEFKIYDALTGGNEVKVVLMDDGVTYCRAEDDEEGVAIVVKNGRARVVGLDNGTYFLEETKAPDGYNKLTARQKFIISDSNLDAVFNGEIFSSGSGVHVVNKTGSMLPETGGLGTLLFSLLGGGTALGAGVVLVTKKRLSKIADED